MGNVRPTITFNPSGKVTQKHSGKTKKRGIGEDGETQKV